MGALHVLTDADVYRLRSIARWIESIGGPGFTNDPRAPSFSSVQRRDFRPRGLDGTYTNPSPLGPSDEHTEAALTDSWDRSDQGANDGVTVYIQTGEAYNEAGDKILYAFVRPFTFDSRGLLREIGVETRVSVDALEPC